MQLSSELVRLRAWMPLDGLKFNFHAFIAANVGGVFLVLGFGCLFALIVAIIEFLWNVKKIAVEDKVSELV